MLRAQRPELLTPHSFVLLMSVGASLSDVGLLHNEHAHTRQEDKAVKG